MDLDMHTFTVLTTAFLISQCISNPLSIPNVNIDRTLRVINGSNHRVVRQQDDLSRMSH